MKKLVKIILLIAGLLVLVAVGAFLFLINSGPTKEAFAALENPRIVEKSDVKSIKVDFNGDPNVVIQEAYSKLFQVYYRLDGVPKWSGQPAPLARYENFDKLLDNVSEAELKAIPWKGFVAIQIPDSITSLSEEAKSDLNPVRLETLEYGTVAEIVHYGPYEEEMATIQKLNQYISEQGYTIVGLHEEEYFKGPGTPFVNPEDYITVIRYQVQKK